MFLLAAEAELAVLLLALGVGWAVVARAAEGSLLAVGALELLLDGYVEEIFFVGPEGGGGAFFALCEAGLVDLWIPKEREGGRGRTYSSSAR
jgi:hypothetical protein